MTHTALAYAAAWRCVVLEQTHDECNDLSESGQCDSDNGPFKRGS
jgi:hypothetical protein